MGQIEHVVGLVKNATQYGKRVLVRFDRVIAMLKSHDRVKMWTYLGISVSAFIGFLITYDKAVEGWSSNRLLIAAGMIWPLYQITRQFVRAIWTKPAADAAPSILSSVRASWAD